MGSSPIALTKKPIKFGLFHVWPVPVGPTSFMSALCQHQRSSRLTFLWHNRSALPPKADMCGATRDVRFVPTANIVRVTRARIHAENVTLLNGKSIVSRRHPALAYLRAWSHCYLCRRQERVGASHSSAHHRAQARQLWHRSRLGAEAAFSLPI
jgi:hypothetical protein